MDKYTQAVLEFWNTQKKALPNWHKAARMIFAISANSCGCERVFALLKENFGPKKKRCLADVIYATISLQYNKRQIY